MIAREYLAFDGINDYVSVPDNNVLSQPTTGALTVSVWIRPDTLNNTKTSGPTDPYVNFISKANPSQNEWMFRIYNALNDDGTPCSRPNRTSFYVFNRLGHEGAGSYVEEEITPRSWIHIVGKVDATHTYIYKNGALKYSRMYQTAGSPATATATMGGSNPNQSVSSITVTDGGTGYEVAPFINVYGGNGSGERFSVSVSDGVVQNTVSVTNPGSGFSSPVTTVVGIVPENTTSNLQIGGTVSGSTDMHFTGAIRDLRIFNRALTNTEISLLYLGSWVQNGLVGKYDFSGGLATDTSVTGNSGTVFGASVGSDFRKLVT